jgi:hypothetical protein
MSGSAGATQIQTGLDKVRTQIPDAQVLNSSDYASLTPGFWVIYYAGPFTDGTQALAYCAAHGRTTSNQCIGRYLSQSPQDRSYACYPPGGPQEASCYRPA